MNEAATFPRIRLPGYQSGNVKDVPGDHYPSAEKARGDRRAPITNANDANRRDHPIQIPL